MRRRGRYGKNFNGLLLVLSIVFLSVFSGYLGTKYVIAPILYSVQESQEEPEQENSGTASEGDSKENEVQGKKESEEGSKAENKGGENVVTGEQEVKELPEEKSTSEQVSQNASVPGNTSGLFCLQFGSFSNKEAAQTCVQELTQKNISTFVMEKEGSFKVLSIPYETKEKAKAAAEQLKTVVEDTYVVSM